MDEDKEDITISIIDPDDTPKAPNIQNKKLTPQAKAAMRFLVDCIDEIGAPPPAWLKLPQSISRTVTVEQWRSHCGRRGLSSGGEGEASKKAFNRAKDKLVEEEIIAVDGDYVWIVYE